MYYDSHVPQVISSSEFEAWLTALKDNSARGRGYRVYFTQRRKSIVILLCAGDKSSQAGDIQRAKQIAAEFKE